MHKTNFTKNNLVQKKILKPEQIYDKLIELQQKEQNLLQQLDNINSNKNLQLDLQLIQSEIQQIQNILKRLNPNVQNSKESNHSQIKFYSDQNNQIHQQEQFTPDQKIFLKNNQKNFRINQSKDNLQQISKNSFIQNQFESKNHDPFDFEKNINNSNQSFDYEKVKYSIENKNHIFNEIQSEIESFQDIDDYEAVKNLFIDDLDKKSEQEQIRILENLRKMSHTQQVQFLQEIIENSKQEDQNFQNSFQQFSFEDQQQFQSQEKSQSIQKNLQVSNPAIQLLQKKKTKRNYEVTNTVKIRQKSKSKSFRKNRDRFRLEFLNFSKINDNLNKLKNNKNVHRNNFEINLVEIKHNNQNENIKEKMKNNINTEQQVIDKKNDIKRQQQEILENLNTLNNNSHILYENLKQNLKFKTAPNLKDKNQFHPKQKLSIEEFCHIPTRLNQIEQPLNIQKSLLTSSTSKLQELKQIQKPQFQLNSKKSEYFDTKSKQDEKNENLNQDYINYSVKEQLTKNDSHNQKNGQLEYKQNIQLESVKQILLKEEPIIPINQVQNKKEKSNEKIKEIRQSAPNKLQRKISLATQNAQSELNQNLDDKIRIDDNYIQDLNSETEYIKSIRLTQTENMTNFMEPLPQRLINKEFQKYKAEEIKRKFRKKQKITEDIDYPQYNPIDEKTEDDTSIEELKKIGFV